MTRRGWVMFASLCVMWGLPYMLIKIALQDLEPAAIVFLRCGLAAVILLPWAAITGRLAALRGHLRWVGLFAICEIGIPWMLTGVAEQHLSSSFTALLIAGVPLLTALIYRFTHLKEHLGIRRSLGLGLGSLGVGLLVGFSLSGSTGPAIAMMAAVILGYTLGPLIIASKLSDLPGGAVVAVSVGLVAVLYAPWGIAQLPHHVTASATWAIGMLAIVCTAGAFLTFFALVVEIGAPRATVVTYINPAVALLLGVVLLSEAVTPSMLLGFPFVIAGSILATGKPVPTVEIR